jgi:uncharacterized protein YndB with AHSA1/START domain
MSLQVQYSHVINRPVEKVFHFMVDEHVRNHPRWDPDIELWLEADEPIRIGTIIHRRNHRGGTPVEGTMEVLELERNRTFATLIHDGPNQMLGRINFEPVGDAQTKVSMVIDLPDMDESMDTSPLMKGLARSAETRAKLIEEEI